MHAVFRADASPAIGGGHIMRCLTLANTLRASGWRCDFAVRQPSMECIPALSQSGHQTTTLDGDTEAEPALMKQYWPQGIDCLIADHYGRDEAFESGCRSWARRIVAIDDLADRRHDCDNLLDQTLGRAATDYAPLVPESCAILTGPRYALLRPEFAAARPASLARRGGGGVGRILVGLGATDPDNATEEVLRGIVLSGLPVTVDVMIGPAATHLERLRRFVEEMPLTCELHVGTAEVAGLMERADVAIGAAGTTSWERCCLGLPSLLVVTATNQEKIAAALQKAGAARIVAPLGGLSAQLIAAALVDLTAKPNSLGRMAECAAEVTDGRGAERFCEAIAS